MDLKKVLSDFCRQSLVYELILALVSLWLLVNLFKETFKEKRPIDFLYYFFEDILLFYYYFFEDILIILFLFFLRYFEYFIIFFITLKS